MRIRSIKPAYWSDHDLHTALSAAEREFYIGLWQQADDAGWLSWDVHRIGAELYPFRTVKSREAFVTASAEKLRALDQKAPHLVIYAHCGHAQVPKMPGHQHLSGKPVYTVMTAHMKCPPPPPKPLPAEAREEPRETAEARHGKGGNGKESNGMAARGKLGSKEPDDGDRVAYYRALQADDSLTAEKRRLYGVQADAIEGQQTGRTAA